MELRIDLTHQGNKGFARFVRQRRWNGTIVRVQTNVFRVSHNSQKNYLFWQK